LELDDVKSVMAQIAAETESDNLSRKEKAALAANLFQTVAKRRNIVLKLNRWALWNKSNGRFLQRKNKNSKDNQT
jgi:hypothetical protein